MELYQLEYFLEAARQPPANCLAARLRGEPIERQVAVLNRSGHAASPSAAVFRKILAATSSAERTHHHRAPSARCIWHQGPSTHG